MSNSDKWSPEWRARQAEQARNMTLNERHGGVWSSTRQRVIVITFETDDEARAWDELPEDAAFALLAAAAAIRSSEAEEDPGEA